MSMNLVERCNLALEAYASALNIIARRAGATSPSTNMDDKPLLRQAGRLALPSVGADREEELPALQSLMGHLRGGTVNAYFTPQLLDMESGTIIPSLERPTDLARQYASTWSAIQRELAAIDPDAAPPVREVATHGILQRYGWSMAAPGAGDTDVTLYDYARVQAALAVCLAEQPAATGEVALLVGGDVSGVQDWLYTIGSEGAAKSLRGRSVYLQLLSEVVANWLLDRLALPSCNLLYAGGGNFYLLAPMAAAEQIHGLQVAVTQRLLKMHSGALYVALGATPLTTTELEESAAGKAWGRANLDMSRRKRQRFAELADDGQMAAAIGSALPGSGLLKDSCKICRRPISETEERREEDDGGHVCQLCLGFEELGRQLPHAEFLVFSRLPELAAAEHVVDWREALRQFGYDVQFVSPDRPWQNQPGDLVRLYFWQQEQPLLSDFPGNPHPARSAWLYRPLAQAAPLEKRRVATFDQLRSQGIKRWGVLRMDLDRLGAIFQEGIQPADLCRVVALSDQLRVFFEGYVPRLARSFNHEDNPNVYLMYAGGDDLFVVGGWSHLPDLAWEIREALRKFAAGNPAITISAGISLALGDRYPIYQAAADAGEAEEMAKQAGRARIVFLGQAVEWKAAGQQDFASVRNRVAELIDLFSKDQRINKSFLSSLRQIDAEWRTWKEHEAILLTDQRSPERPRYIHRNKRLYLGPWEWHLIYSLSRAADRKADGIVKEAISHYVDSIVASEIEVLGLEARWAEFLIRGESS